MFIRFLNWVATKSWIMRTQCGGASPNMLVEANSCCAIQVVISKYIAACSLIVVCYLKILLLHLSTAFWCNKQYYFSFRWRKCAFFTGSVWSWWCDCCLCCCPICRLRSSNIRTTSNHYSGHIDLYFVFRCDLYPWTNTIQTQNSIINANNISRETMRE